jgi:hypothetical protein
MVKGMINEKTDYRTTRDKPIWWSVEYVYIYIYMGLTSLDVIKILGSSSNAILRFNPR